MCILFFWKLTEFWDRLVLSICAKTRHDLCSSDQRTFQKNNYSFYDTLTSCSEVISVTSSPSYLEFILFTSFLNNTCVDRWADKFLMSGREVWEVQHISLSSKCRLLQKRRQDASWGLTVRHRHWPHQQSGQSHNTWTAASPVIVTHFIQQRSDHQISWWGNSPSQEVGGSWYGSDQQNI